MSEMKRLLIQMGQGTDSEGDATAAARAAIENARQGADLRIFETLDLDPGRAELRVGLGLPDPYAANLDALRNMLEAGPWGKVVIRPCVGGLAITDPLGGHEHVTVAAALETFVPDAGGPWRADG
ncbi:hypothetical protein BV394_00670 [Brevirhabdus pacifica]|uniref:Uncharacterized protein n=1 Tax=Brevirhabdus pacifica TaxID=1267768 RepID=A0A1U7DEQ4_9RHOB|nr:Lin0512 family protein [Brevirhabdus pacifica]APX88425.1 hypothetical protein BV394_00670 [Brevirhabdus pacifica]OWU79733.1 hypothetical protein ATO5_01365 [Loktanella sp. 22II-4b]PJJ87111.1 uncharacterized protein (TIGR02058 family) [Brevirhabdus pacifica]